MSRDLNNSVGKFDRPQYSSHVTCHFQIMPFLSRFHCAGPQRVSDVVDIGHWIVLGLVGGVPVWSTTTALSSPPVHIVTESWENDKIVAGAAHISLSPPPI